MTINFMLNWEEVVVRANAECRLSDLLRNTFNLMETKSGCNIGNCGACSVFFNGDVVKSCLIPVFKIRGSEVITIEGFSKTSEYKDIVKGFSEAGVDACGFCVNCKILTTEALLAKNPRPSRGEILEAFFGIKCRCTEPDSLVRGVMAVSEKRRMRYHERSH